MMESVRQFDEVRPRVDRVTYVKTVQLERTSITDQGGECPHRVTKGLSINVSSRGLCLLLDWAPDLREIVRIHMPMPVATAQTPTLADVRWVRPVVFHGKELAIVGLQFAV